MNIYRRDLYPAPPAVCPKCDSPITVVYKEPHDHEAKGFEEQIFYCTNCRACFLNAASIDGRGDDTIELDELDIPQPPVKVRIDGNSELFSARVFHLAGLLIAVIALFWDFITVIGVFGILPGGGFSPTASIITGGMLVIVGFVLTMSAITLLANRISLEYFPATGKIVYRKGPFNWWSKRFSFNASEIALIHASAALAAEGDYLYTAIHFNNGRKEHFLDFSQKDKVRMQFECLLRIMSVRAAAENPTEKTTA
ncbi:MAG: hypothetical protein IJJ33_19650 [Victivallales bacterium]|nr:hypothetical protein [Victivallales bacterium]